MAEGRQERQPVDGALPADRSRDVGREYESDVIRINSQSGKGGIAFILKQNYGISLPDGMKEEVGYLVKGVSDRSTRSWHRRIFIRFLKKIIFCQEAFFISLNAISGRRTGLRRR